MATWLCHLHSMFTNLCANGPVSESCHQVPTSLLSPKPLPQAILSLSTSAPQLLWRLLPLPCSQFSAIRCQYPQAMLSSICFVTSLSLLYAEHLLFPTPPQCLNTCFPHTVCAVKIAAWRATCTSLGLGLALYFSVCFGKSRPSCNKFLIVCKTSDTFLGFYKNYHSVSLLPHADRTLCREMLLEYPLCCSRTTCCGLY